MADQVKFIVDQVNCVAEVSLMDYLSSIPTLQQKKINRAELETIGMK